MVLLFIGILLGVMLVTQNMIQTVTLLVRADYFKRYAIKLEG